PRLPPSLLGAGPSQPSCNPSMFLARRRPPAPTLFPYTTLFRSLVGGDMSRGPLSVAIQATGCVAPGAALRRNGARPGQQIALTRSEEHTSELQSRFELVCRLLLEKKKKNILQMLNRETPTTLLL